jgi:hypothetical protein
VDDDTYIHVATENGNQELMRLGRSGRGRSSGSGDPT